MNKIKCNAICPEVGLQHVNIVCVCFISLYKVLILSRKIKVFATEALLKKNSLSLYL